MGPDGEGGVVSARPPSIMEANGGARKMTADLLEALRKVEMLAICPTGKRSSRAGLLDEIWMIARDAIAKAKSAGRASP